MCLIIKTDKNLPLSEALLKDMVAKNDDGWGMMWIKSGELLVEKSGPTPFVDLWNAYLKRIEFNPIIHLRWKTHGEINEHNAHPYYCGSGIFLMHNGTVNAPVTSHSQHSDTWNFIESWIKPIFKLVKNPHELIRSKAFKTLLEHEIGNQNRIVMGDRGGFVTFNEKAWHTITNEHTKCEGLIVSNTYAWDATNFGKPIPKVTSVTYLPVQNRSGIMRNALGELMELVVGNIYINAKKEAWTFSNERFYRAWALDKRIDNIKTAYKAAVTKKDRKQLRKQWKLEAQSSTGSSTGSTVIIPTATEVETFGGWEHATWEDSCAAVAVQQPLLLTAPKKPELTEEEMDARDAAFADIARLSASEYTDILCKEWSQHRPGVINSLVYTQPDDAALCLSHLFNHFYRPGI